MSRLIDADKLPATCNVAIVNGKVELNGWIAAERITEAPTVKAIPVEWIKKYIDSTLDKDNSQMLGFKAAIIKEMIEEWEKENERETDRH